MFEKLLFNKKKNIIIDFLIVLIYFVLNIFLIKNHEIWRDEAQAWVIAKNLSLTEIFNILCTEGHPCLWFLFLIPFVKLGLPFEYIGYLSLIIMCLAAYILLSSSPFSTIINIGILFSSIFLFYNPVVCRIYSLIALLIILIAKYHNQRLEKPILYGILVSLIFQTHVLAFGLAIGLLIELVIDYFKNTNNKKIIVAIVITVFSFICAILEIMPRSNNTSGIDTSASSILTNLSLEKITGGMQYLAYTAWGWLNKETYFIPYILFFLCVVFIFVFISKNKTWENNYSTIIIAICGCGVFFGIVWLVYKPHSQMSSILTMILLFIVWILFENNKDKNIKIVSILLLGLISFLSFSVCQSVMRQDINGYYSTSKLTAEFISNNVTGNDVVVIENCVYDTTIYAYVNSNNKDIEFYDLRNKQDFVFYQAGSDIINDKLTLNYIIDTSLNELSHKNNVYYLTNSLLNDNRLQLIYSNEDIETISGENYYIYLIKE